LSFSRCAVVGCNEKTMIRLNLFRNGEKFGLCEKHIKELSKSKYVFKAKYKFESEFYTP